MKTKILVITLMVMMLLMVYFMVPVFAETSNELKPLIILNNGLNDACLELEGYFIIDSNVDLYHPGEYVVTYSDKEGNLKTREVVVIDQEQREYFQVKSQTIDTFLDYPMKLEYVESFNSQQQLLIIKYLTDENTNNCLVYMYILNNGEITKSVQLKYNVDMTIKDVLIDNDCFLITGTIYNTLYANYDVVFYVCNSSGLQIYSKDLGGTSSDIGYQIEKTKEAYIILGLTDSQDGIFKDNKKTNSFFIMTLDKQNFEVIAVQTEPCELDFEQLTFLNVEEQLYLVYQSDDYTLKLVNISDSGKYLKTKFINFLEKVKLKKVYIENNLIHILNETGDNFQIGTINLQDGYHECAKYPKNGQYVTSHSSDHLFRILTFDEDEYQLLLINSDYQLVYNKILPPILDKNSNIMMIDNQIIEDIDDQEKIKIHSINFISILSLGNTEIQENDIYDNYLLLINGKEVYHNVSKSKDLINKQQFGEYEVTYYFDGDLDLVFSKKVLVMAEAGVVDQGTYDLGVVLKLNGEGYLNNQRIEQEYQINQPGHYELELKGNNNQQTLINFDVKRISLQGVSKDEKQVLWNIQTEENDIPEDLPNVSLVQSVTTKVAKNDKWNWFYTVPLMIAAAAGFIVIKMHY